MRRDVGQRRADFVPQLRRIASRAEPCGHQGPHRGSGDLRRVLVVLERTSSRVGSGAPVDDREDLRVGVWRKAGGTKVWEGLTDYQSLEVCGDGGHGRMMNEGASYHE